jgi:hypothetical protein
MFATQSQRRLSFLITWLVSLLHLWAIQAVKGQDGQFSPLMRKFGVAVIKKQ